MTFSLQDYLKVSFRAKILNYIMHKLQNSWLHLPRSVASVGKFKFTVFEQSEYPGVLGGEVGGKEKERKSKEKRKT